MKKTFLRLLIGFGVLSIINMSMAAPVSVEQARLAVDNWLAEDASLGCRLGTTAADVKTYTTTNGASFHLVALNGGGFVVTTADTTLAPIIAFADGNIEDFKEKSTLWCLVNGDIAKTAPVPGVRRKLSAENSRWTRLLTPKSARKVQRLNSLSDVRVAPFVKSAWSQDKVGSGYCYNYYTPNHYVCGCVATSGSQIMHYFRFPDSTYSVPKATRTCTVDGVDTSLTMQGGYYDWSKMPDSPGYYMTEAQRQAIGKLTSDYGIMVEMGYSSDGSGTYVYKSQYAFQQFGYSSTKYMYSNNMLSSNEKFRQAILSNMNARRPVQLGVDNGREGHAIVGDGYGYSDNQLYVHLNMGWGGSYNAWYLLDNIDSGSYTFNNISEMIYSVYTTEPGSTVICSGRIVDTYGAAVVGATVSARRNGQVVKSVTSDNYGIYALEIPAGTYEIEAKLNNSVEAADVTLAENVNSVNSWGSFINIAGVRIGNRYDLDFTLGREINPIVEYQRFMGLDVGDITDPERGFTLAGNGNIAERKSVTITDYSMGGIRISWPAGMTNITAIFDANLPERTTGNQSIITVFASDEADRVGVRRDVGGKGGGIWQGNAWTPGASSTLQTDAITTGDSRFAMRYRGDLGISLMQCVNGQWKTVYFCDGLKSSSDVGTITGLALGGRWTSDTMRYADFKLYRIAIFDERLAESRIGDFNFSAAEDAKSLRVLIR